MDSFSIRIYAEREHGYVQVRPDGNCPCILADEIKRVVNQFYGVK